MSAGLLALDSVKRYLNGCISSDSDALIPDSLIHTIYHLYLFPHPK